MNISSDFKLLHPFYRYSKHTKMNEKERSWSFLWENDFIFGESPLWENDKRYLNFKTMKNWIAHQQFTVETKIHSQKRQTITERTHGIINS